MKPEELLHKDFEMLNRVSMLPRKILGLQGHDHMPAFVLHDLCHEKCFNFDRAAYLVDNPDFDCLKGVAGISLAETNMNSDIWKNPDGFSKKIENSNFNKKVRELNRGSVKRNNSSMQDIAAEIAQDLGMNKFAHCSWNMKHDNHGMLIFETGCHHNSFNEDQLLNGLSLLSFCPVY